MMKSKTVRSFGKVFETRLGKVLGKALRCHVLCLIVLCVIVGCAEETVPAPLLRHIVSPYTVQTIAFFERSGSDDWPNMLVSVEIDGQRCILKKQTQAIRISLEKYTLETVPEQLAQGIEFDILIMVPNDRDKIAQFDPAVLEKILCVFGTICADILDFSNLDLDGSRIKNMIQRMGRSVGRLGRTETPELAPATPITKCILTIKTLLIQKNTLPTIIWLQKRLDLTQCRINLTIRGELQLKSLELVDRFGAASIETLWVLGINTLGSLECKLLREGPLPEELAILEKTSICPIISEEIAHNIITKEWRALVVSMVMWKKLMNPSNQPKLFTAGELVIYIPHYGMFTMPPAPSLPVMGDNIATAKSLTIHCYDRNGLVYSPIITPIIDWISRHFRGLEDLVVGGPYIENNFAEFFQKNQVEITTNPGLTSIGVGDVECLYSPPRTEVLCLSLEAWKLYKSGKLADELARTQTDLSVLSPEHQTMIMSQEEMAADDDDPCCVCLSTITDLKSDNPNTELCILDSPKHPICIACLDDLICSGRRAGLIKCPSCRKEHMLPFVKNKVRQNSQGVFVITIPAPLHVLSFPRPTPDATPTAI
ncbi:hypothetical protein NEDG_02216 [Nematocida displodere]|uniref:RING-type domain-containing protein n=1 Tax=Nematocida displodere TaxID=1805483 RepID=A0A177EFK7_9MICR|nr:hypothetical protein NEDG_02216 [Nematocida displodere]